MYKYIRLLSLMYQIITKFFYYNICNKLSFFDLCFGNICTL